MSQLIKIIKRANTSFVDKLIANMASLNRVHVGVPAGKKEEDGVPVALVAATHEYGSPSQGIPERPFLRNTIIDNLPKYKTFNRANLLKVFKGGMDEATALGRLGAMAAGDVQRFIRSNNYELKESTKERKGSSKALIDTGQLVQSITFEVSDDKRI